MSDLTTVDGLKHYWSIKPSNLATADGQKNYRGRKKLGRGGKKRGEHVCSAQVVAFDGHYQAIRSEIMNLTARFSTM